MSRIDGYGLGSAPAYVKSALVKKYLNNNEKLIHSILFPMFAAGAVGANGKLSIPVYTANDGVYLDGSRATKAPIGQTDEGTWSYIEVEPEEISDSVETDVRDYNKMIGAGGAQTANGVDELLWGGKIAKINLSMEKYAATLATTTTNYDSNNLLEKTGDRWDTTDGDPLSDCTEVLENMMLTSQVMPNVMWLSPDAWKSFSTNANVLGKVASTSTQKVDFNWIINYFESYGIQRVVIGWAAEKDTSGAITPVWSDKVGFLHATTDLTSERFATNYVDSVNIELTKEIRNHNTLYSHAGRIMSKFQVISDVAGGLITGINTP